MAKKIIVQIFVWLSICWLTYQPMVVQAQSSEGVIRVVPAFQEITLDETTQVATASIQITNTSTTEQQFGISPVDIQQFDSNGQVILAEKPLTGQNFALASFIKLTADKITIPKQSSIVVPLIITNTQSLSPGGHYTAIVARLISATGNDQQILPAVSSFLLVRKVGGEQFHLSLKESPLLNTFSAKLPRETTLTFSNQGNVHVIPRGTIVIKDYFGREVGKSIINENSLYVFPGTERVVTQKIQYSQSLFVFAPLSITITGTSQPGSIPYQQSGWFFYINPFGSALVLIIFGLLGYAMKKTLRKKAQR